MGVKKAPWSPSVLKQEVKPQVEFVLSILESNITRDGESSYRKNYK
jgi:hypothetical protein